MGANWCDWTIQEEFCYAPSPYVNRPVYASMLPKKGHAAVQMKMISIKLFFLASYLVGVTV